MTTQNFCKLKAQTLTAVLFTLVGHSSLAAEPCNHFAAERQPFLATYTFTLGTPLTHSYRIRKMILMVLIGMPRVR